jgi:hypothetical protein
VTRPVLGAILLVLLGGVAAAQEFQPPRVRSSAGAKGIGLYGFGVRGGLDWRNGQMIFGATLDVGDLFIPRLRLRPSAELGVFKGDNTYIGSFEGLYRFTGDDEMAIPYIGTGLSLAGHANCGQDPKCPNAWINLVFGFELHYKSTFNWLLEYHGLDAMRRHRVYIGLTTRRGN